MKLKITLEYKAIRSAERLIIEHVHEIKEYGDYLYIKPFKKKQVKLLRKDIIDIFVEKV